jgi:hypothetical protein
MRIQIYNWFGRWLKGETKTIEEEPDSTMEPESALFVAPSGSVVRSFHSETPFSMNRKRTVVRSPARLDTLLALDRPPKAPMATLSRASFRDARIEVVEFAAAPGVWVPAWLFLPKQPEAIKSVVITLEPSGRTSWHENQLYDQLAAAGAAVCAPDLRGIGDLTPEFGRHSARNAREHANDEMWAWSSLVLGKPLAGQRVTDLLAVVQGLRARPDLKGKSLVLAARGFPTVPALFAAALEPEIDHLYLAGGLVSFQSIVDTEDYDHPFGNFVPNLLLHTDLPKLAASLAPRRVVIAGAVDGAGRRMAPEDVRKQYAGASHVEVLPDELWNPTNILGGGQS